MPYRTGDPAISERWFSRARGSVWFLSPSNACTAESGVKGSSPGPVPASVTVRSRQNHGRVTGGHGPSRTEQLAQCRQSVRSPPAGVLHRTCRAPDERRRVRCAAFVRSRRRRRKSTTKVHRRRRRATDAGAPPAPPARPAHLASATQRRPVTSCHVTWRGGRWGGAKEWCELMRCPPRGKVVPVMAPDANGNPRLTHHRPASCRD